MIRLAFQEIRNHPRFSFFFLLNLFLGFFGLLSLDTFKVSLEQSLSARSRTLLGGDLSISVRRPLTPTEERMIQTTLPSNHLTSGSTELFSMVSAGKQSRLAEVVAIEDGYPLYGGWELEQAGTVGAQVAHILTQQPIAWIDKELAIQLGVRIGDQLQLGKTFVEIRDIVKSHTVSGSRGMKLASRLYVGKPSLEKAGLLRFGSTATYRKLYMLAADQPAEQMVGVLNRALTDPAIRVASHERAGQQVGRLQGFLNDYLGLASLVSLFLAAVGAGYLFRGFLTRRLHEIAILRSLGLSPVASQGVYLLTLITLGTFAALAATAVAWSTLPFVIRVLGTVLSVPMDVVFPFRSLILALVLGSVGSIVVCLPYLLSLPSLKPAVLFQEQLAASQLQGKLVGILPGLVLFGLLAVWQSRSWKVGALFTGVFLIAGAFLATVAWFAIQFSEKKLTRLSIEKRLALRGLARDRMGSTACFVAIALGALLMSLVPQIKNSLAAEVERPDVSVVPSLFLFDIQDEQLQPLTSFLKEKGYRFSAVSPLIRGRLLSINGKAFEKEIEAGQMRTREDESSARIRNRGFNLTYRTHLTESEKILKGRDFSGQAPVVHEDGSLEGEISVEQRFAKRLKVGIGDVLDFDVQEIPVRGRIVNLRQVKWTSFQPNFFVQFQPGVLEDAPKSWIASIAKLGVNERATLQHEIIERFPTISIIDVSSVIERLLGIFTQMAWAIRWMAVLSLFGGLVVLFSIASYQAFHRRSDTLLLKILGGSHGLLKRLVDWEFGLLGFTAASSGVILSIGISYLFSRVLFDQVWVFSFWMPLVAILLVTFVSLLTARLAIRSTLNRKVMELLQE